MATKAQTADKFTKGERASCHNATVTLEDRGMATGYRLHGHMICHRTTVDCKRAIYRFDWCGWFTPTTASHMNAILDAIGGQQRVSYAQARDGKAPAQFTIEV